MTVPDNAVQPRSFYVVSTPYHILLAVAHAERAGLAPSLFLLGNFAGAQAYADALSGPGEALLPGLEIEAAVCAYGDRARYRAQLPPLRRALKAAGARQLWVFNDHNDLSQYALSWAARQGVACGAIEDGSSFYTDWVVARHDRRWRQWRKRWTFCRHWTALTVPGTHPLLTSRLALRPDLVRDELRGRCEPLDVDVLRSPALRRLAARLAASCAAQARPGAGQWLEQPVPDRLLLAPARGALPEEACTGLGSLAFKYHPREAEADPLGLRRLGRELPRHWPVELIYLHWGAVPDEVVGEAGSTVLLTSRLMSPQTRVFGYRTAGLAAAPDALYARLGIELVSPAPAAARAA